MIHCRHLLVLLALGCALQAQVQVSLQAAKDNTLFEDGSGGFSNGIGVGFYAGVTTNGLKRRGLVAFDVAASIPAGARIDSVTLTLNVTQINTLNPQSLDIALHRVLGDWGEGASNSTFMGGGGGAPSQPGDATWLHRFFPGQSWFSPGGDFNPNASASSTIGTVLGAYTWSAPGMIADVQSWLDNPGQDFGWLLLADEETSGNAKRFATREFSIVPQRPLLSISYTPFPGSGEDLQIRTAVGSLAPSLDPLKSSGGGQLLSLLLESPLGSYVGTPPMVAAQLAPSGMLPFRTPFYPELHLDFSPGAHFQPVILLSGLGTPGMVLGLPLNGVQVNGPAPTGLAGSSILLQGFCFAPSTQAGNPWFTVTDSHQITLF